MIDQNMTDDEIEAYNVRQRDKRQGFLDAVDIMIPPAFVHSGALTPAQDAAKRYPYLRRQEKTVTVSGYQYRYRGVAVECRHSDRDSWRFSAWTTEDIRKLASLLDRSSTIIEDSTP